MSREALRCAACSGVKHGRVHGQPRPAPRHAAPGSLQAPRTVRLLSPCCRLDTRKWGLAQSLLPGPAESPRCSGCPRTLVLPVAQPVPGAQRCPCGHWGQALARSGGRALSGGCCPRKRGLCRPLEPGGTTGRGSRKAGRFSLLGTVSFFPFLFFKIQCSEPQSRPVFPPFEGFRVERRGAVC